MERKHGRRPALVQIRKLGFEILGNHLHFAIGLRDGDAGFEASDYRENVRGHAEAGVELERGPQLDIPEGDREIHLAGQYSGDRIRPAVDLNRASQNIAFPAQFVLPKTIADQNHAGRAGSIFLSVKSRAEHGLNAQRPNESGRDLGADDLSGFLTAAEVVILRKHAGQLFERAGLLHPFLVVHSRYTGRMAVRPFLPEQDEAVRVAKRQRLQDYGVKNAENRCIRADAQRESEDGRKRKNRLFRQRPKSDPKIAHYRKILAHFFDRFEY